MTGAIADLLLMILQIYQWIVIAAVIVSWLVNFNVINVRNQFVRMIVSTLYALTEPLFCSRRLVAETDDWFTPTSSDPNAYVLLLAVPAVFA